MITYPARSLFSYQGRAVYIGASCSVQP